jgi:hypothetical protein
MRDAKASLPIGMKVVDINKTRSIRVSADINYGIVDIADISRYIGDKSIDFIITDPPYAGLVFYLDLSLVWLVWLQKIDKKYVPDLKSEITIKKGQIGREEYRRRLTNAFKQLHRVLKDNGRLVITFHHKKMQEWNDFVQAVRIAGFKFDKVTHQYNRRSGESNVSNPYGTSGADFYIRCVKYREVDFTDDASGLGHFVIQKAIEIIAIRNEPTPYSFILNGLVPELLQAGFVKPKEYREEIDRILSTQLGPGKTFTKMDNTENKAGDYWWFVDPSQHINYPDRPLKDRVDETVLSLLRRRISVRLDDILAELFRTYPNGLTPDPKGIRSILEKYAYRSADHWKIKDTTLKIGTEHTEVIRQLLVIGKKSGYLVYIGKREQPEYCKDGSQLVSMSDVKNLDSLRGTYDSLQIARIEMIDNVWLTQDGKAIKCIFEVENSTGFMSSIQRASNTEESIPKFMVLPTEREQELLAVRDPLFRRAFSDNNWRYATYDFIQRLLGYSHPSVDQVLAISKELQ